MNDHLSMVAVVVVCGHITLETPELYAEEEKEGHNYQRFKWTTLMPPPAAAVCPSEN